MADRILTEKDRWTQERIDILRQDAERWRKKAEAMPAGEEKLAATDEANKADRLADTIALWIHEEAEKKKLAAEERRKHGRSKPGA